MPPRKPQKSGLSVGMWSAILVVVIVVVGIIVWAGLKTPSDPTANDQERENREAVQTPDDTEPPEVSEASDNVAVPPPQDAQPVGDSVVRMPAFAPWAPGTLIETTSDYPEPEQDFTVNVCTVAFSFSNDKGDSFAVTAGHCGKEGDLVWPGDANSFEQFDSEVGYVIYSGLKVPNQVNTDVGIIQIVDPDRVMPIVGNPLLTGMAENLVEPTDRICKNGSRSGHTCGQLKKTGENQTIYPDDGEQPYQMIGNLGAVCAEPGDSGGPVFQDVDGRPVIIGMVTGVNADQDYTEECYEGMQYPRMMAYAPIEQVMDVVNQVVPDAQWEFRNW